MSKLKQIKMILNQTKQPYDENTINVPRWNWKR